MCVLLLCLVLSLGVTSMLIYLRYIYVVSCINNFSPFLCTVSLYEYIIITHCPPECNLVWDYYK